MGSLYSLKKEYKSSLESHSISALFENSNVIGFLALASLFAGNYALRGYTSREASKNENEESFEATGINRDDKVHSVRIKACWLGNGFLAALGSAFLSVPLTFTPLTHHWVEIKVSANKWYTLQLSKTNFLRLNAHSSEKEADLCGSGEKDKSITVKKSIVLQNIMTIGRVYHWVVDSNKKYDLLNHNCQIYAKEFFKWVQKPEISN